MTYMDDEQGCSSVALTWSQRVTVRSRKRQEQVFEVLTK